ncbi:MAG: SDR family NAD(P)-dependent oxidoreductase [Planctomycetota bacterium]|nr:MAG: SDR family NAD(P)-dependent oxidoreductase [Planctomycetota bacterium]
MIFSHKRISGTAVVTGAASGLGKAIALELARDGWRLALIDVPVEGLDSGDSTAMVEVLKIARASGGGGLIAAFDVRDADSWQQLHD